MIKNILRNALLIFLSISTVIATVEILARLLPTDSLPGTLPIIVRAMRLQDNTFFRRDPYFRHITAANLNSKVEHADFTYRVETKLNIGQVGFRGGSQAGPIWGVAVGDSFTFGMGVEHESTWVFQLANLLHREIVNLGVPGWGPQQYTRAIERYGIPIQPKVFFYAVYRNDIQDALRFDQWLRDPPYKRSVDSFLGSNSIIFNVLRLTWTDSVPETANIYFDGTNIKYDSQNLKSTLQMQRDHFAAAWALTQPQIELARTYSQKSGARLVLLYLPAKVETYWDLIKRKEASLEAFDDSVEIFRRQLSSFCQAQQLPYLDLTPPLRARASRGETLYFPHDNHWTAAGNRAAAREIHDFLIAKEIAQ